MKIVICGSCTFAKEMGKTAKQLEKIGHEAFPPDPLVTEEWYQANYGRVNFLEMKPVWTKNHMEKIKNADAVLISNHEKKGIKGYFGSNTLMELSVAFFLDKKIYFLFPIEENHPHFEELTSMKVAVLDNDLSKIK